MRRAPPSFIAAAAGTAGTYRTFPVSPSATGSYRPLGISSVSLVRRRRCRKMGQSTPLMSSYRPIGDDDVENKRADYGITENRVLDANGVGDLEADGIAEPNPLSPGLVDRTAPLDGRVLFGEFLCTFLFVYLSLNAAVQGTPLSGSINNAAVIAAIAASFMPVSGAHLNPAVTVALACTNRVSPLRALLFIPVQLAASVAAALLVRALGLPVVFPGIATGANGTLLTRAFFAELMPMFIIVIVVFQTAVATEREGGVGMKLAAMYIGLAVLACAGTFTTGVFNPARAFGPAVVAGNLVSHWIYWVGPMVGAMSAAFVS